MLSATLFLAMIQQFTSFMFPTIKVHYCADNLELIKRQQAHAHYTLPYSNTTLGAEFDLTEQIFLTQQQYKIQATFEHVKGHQDTNTPLHKLSIQAKLNVEADALAEYTYHEASVSSTITFTLPSSPAQLTIANKTISSSYKKHLIRAYTEPQYIEKIQQKFNWNNSTTEAIAWKALACSIRRIDRKCLTTKICNDLLPVAEYLKKIRYQASDKCSLCGAIETREHLFMCLAQPRIK